MKNTYIVIAVNSGCRNIDEAVTQELPSRVNAMIEQGYMPIGGITAAVTPEDYMTHFYQAMMLKGEKDGA